MARRCGRRRRDHEVVRDREEITDIGDDLDIIYGRGTTGSAIGHHFHVECERSLRRGGADGADPDKPEGAARQLSEVAVCPLAGPVDPDVRDLLGEGEHRSEDELRYSRRARSARAGEDLAVDNFEGKSVDTGLKNMDPPDLGCDHAHQSLPLGLAGKKDIGTTGVGIGI